jgi:Fe-S oxidoreductase
MMLVTKHLQNRDAATVRGAESSARVFATSVKQMLNVCLECSDCTAFCRRDINIGSRIRSLIAEHSCLGHRIGLFQDIFD